MQFAIHLATPEDDDAIRALLRREPMPGRIRIGYQREPNFRLGCDATGDDTQILVARDQETSEVVGLACRSVRRVFVNGFEQRLGYLGQLRVDARYRGRWLVSRGFAQLKRMHDQDPLPGYLVSIVDGNLEATGVLVRKRRRGFPTLQKVADYCTFAIEVTRPRPVVRGSVEISIPQRRDRAELSRFLRSDGSRKQFFPVWTEEDIERASSFGLGMQDMRVARSDGKLVGVVGLWDQSAYKQTVVHGYSRWLETMLPVYNAVAPWFGRGALPHPGEKLQGAYASLLCVANDEVAVFRCLLREIYKLAHLRGMCHLIVGLDSRDSLLAAAREYPHTLYGSSLYLAKWPGGNPSVEQLDGRPLYLDAATL